MSDTASSYTWGIDLSTNPRHSAAVKIAWDDGRPRVDEVVTRLTSDAIVDLVCESNGRVAVDVPFGWPDAFVEYVRSHQQSRQGPLPSAGLATSERAKHLAHRHTDLRLIDDLEVRPLPAAFDRLGKTAVMWSGIERDLRERGIVIDRAGVDGRVCETYPAAALSAWGLGRTKQSVDEMERSFPFLMIGERERNALAASADARDALVCSLAARARDLEKTVMPKDEAWEAARREGWIHVTEPCDSRTLLGDGLHWLAASLHVPTLRDLDEEGPKRTFDFPGPDGDTVNSLRGYAQMRGLEEHAAAEEIVSYPFPTAVPASLSQEAWRLLSR